MEKIENKRIVKNTLMLYIRMILMMIVSLYTSRALLQVLGVVDFGIYNVVGGVVMMLSFLQGALNTSIQRYLTYYLGIGDYVKLQRVFVVSSQILLLASLIIVAISETIGIWFMHAKMVIPNDRLVAAHWVFQLSIVVMVLQIMSVPYNAVIIAHERMKAFAYISTIEVSLRLVIVYLLLVFNYDKLIVFAILMALVQFIIRFIYSKYCIRHFEESRLSFYWNNELFKEIGSFAGWNLFGGLAGTFYSQGLNLLLNVFFGPTVNAARAICTQVEAALNQFSTNFQMAVNPQITKKYATGNISEMHSLLFRTSKFSFYLVLIFALPLFFSADYVLKLWLSNVPEYTSSFVKIMLCTILVNSTAQPIAIAAAATGRVKKYQSLVGGILLLILPVSYIALKLGCEASSVYIVHFFIILLSCVVRLIVVRPMISLSLCEYSIKVCYPIVKVLVTSIVFGLIIALMHTDAYVRIIQIVLMFITTLFSCYLFGLDVEERKFMLDKAKTFVNRFAK